MLNSGLDAWRHAGEKPSPGQPSVLGSPTDSTGGFAQRGPKGHLLMLEKKARARSAVKTTIALSPDAAQVLRALAQERNTTFAEVIRRALSVDKYLADVARNGGTIFVEDPEKNITKVVLF